MAAQESETRDRVLLLSDAMKEALGELPVDVDENSVAVHHVGRDATANFMKAGVRYQRCGGGYRIIRKHNKRGD